VPDQENASADDAVNAKDSEDAGAGNKGAAKSDLKNTLVMIVVGVISVVCAFIFVTKIHSSKDVYDITTSADASTPRII
jgi:hypothetical protein